MLKAFENVKEPIAMVDKGSLLMKLLHEISISKKVFSPFSTWTNALIISWGYLLF